ncbi:MAG: hypothetical protein N2321_07790 [Melioribacteraceae bacterium]|nr:hypothetical protein [Melioribacteraceae bacterium]
MKRTAIFFAILLGLFLVAESSNAQTVGNQNKGAKTNWVDANGDGICDNVGTSAQGSGKGYGKKDGSGTPAQPKDGTGFGAKNKAANSESSAGNNSSGSMFRRGRK